MSEPEKRHASDASPADNPGQRSISKAIDILHARIALGSAPEWEYFENEWCRETALRNFGGSNKHVRARDQLKALGWGVAGCFATYLGGRVILGHFVSSLALHIGLAGLAGVVVQVFIMRRFSRLHWRLWLREELLNQGVPVCMACGYLLRGLTVETGRCPECGKEFDGLVRVIITNAQVNAAEGDVSPHK